MADYTYRQADTVLHITDKDGNAAANSVFKVRQTEHEFLFGCGAFDAMAAANEKKGDPFYEDRMKKWCNLYNYGTMSFYWGLYEPTEGMPEFENRMNASKYLTERGKKVKGHPLCWHTECADWLMNYDNHTILEKQLERIDREVSSFAGVIDMWDVINEVVIMPIFDKYDNAVTRICKEKGRIGLVKEVFAAAKESNPNATLLINDFETSESYEILLEGLLEAGVPISAIGIQSHQHQGFWGMEKLNDVLERYSRFGLPIHFTENTLISGEIMPPHIVDLNDWQVDEWPTTPEGEERQAKEIGLMYRTLFAHPLVEAITSWDFHDDAWLHAPAGLVRTDNSEKPSYQVLKDLIHGEWETHQELVTDENGYIDFEGFKGGYTVTGNTGSAKFELCDDGIEIRHILPKE